MEMVIYNINESGEIYAKGDLDTAIDALSHYPNDLVVIVVKGSAIHQKIQEEGGI